MVFLIRSVSSTASWASASFFRAAFRLLRALLLWDLVLGFALLALNLMGEWREVRAETRAFVQVSASRFRFGLEEETGLKSLVLRRGL